MWKPDNAPNEVGHLMASCWEADPKQRPTFNELTEELGYQLGASVLNRYAELSAPYDSK